MKVFKCPVCFFNFYHSETKINEVLRCPLCYSIVNLLRCPIVDQLTFSDLFNEIKSISPQARYLARYLQKQWK